MPHFDRRSFVKLAFGSAFGVAVGSGLSSGLHGADDIVLDRGFVVAAKPYTTGAEIARQMHVWEMEVQLKSMRLIMAPIPGNPKPQQVWYLAYRAIPRPILKNTVGEDTDPVNTLDPPPGPPMFIPQLTIVTYDNRETEVPVQIVVDRVLPAAMKMANTIERPESPERSFLDSVSIVQPVPEPVPADVPEQPWIHGVASWSGIDARTDFFKVIMQGFTNVYEVRGEGDERRTWRKVLVQKFTSRGDEFDPTQREFEFDGKPFWEFQPDKKSHVEIAADRATAATAE